MFIKHKNSYLDEDNFNSYVHFRVLTVRQMSDSIPIEREYEEISWVTISD